MVPQNSRSRPCVREIEQALAAGVARTPASRALLEVLRDLAAGDRVRRAEARQALEKREGKPISEATFAARLKRLNDELAKASPPLRIVSERGALRIDDGTPALEARLAERSHRETLREGVGKQPPRAAPESLLVLFSYAWQPEEAQQNAQLDLYDRLTHVVNHRPPEFDSLPKNSSCGATPSGSRSRTERRRRSKPPATAPFSSW